MRVALLVGAAFLCVVGSAAAEVRDRWALLGGGGVWLHPELGGHGIGLVAYDVTWLDGGGHLSAELNTDTLRLGYDQLRFAGGHLELGAALAAEGLFAGLLPDYYRDGERDDLRGFWASYLAAGAFLKAHLPGRNYVTLEAGARRWFFSRRDDTEPALTMPADAWVFEPRLRYTLWWIEHDPSIADRQRLFLRVRGIAVGIEAGLDYRSAAHRWGALDDTVFDPVDPRNDPRRLILMGRQWLRAGLKLNRLVRTQIAELAAIGRGEDDLTRVRVGGLNPYVVPIAGAPWAAFLSDRLVAGEWSVHVNPAGDWEIGSLLHVALLQDVHRVGAEGYGVVSGVGAFSDLRVGPIQLDVRAGWTPSLRQRSRAGQFAVFVAFGTAR